MPTKSSHTPDEIMKLIERADETTEEKRRGDPLNKIAIPFPSGVISVGDPVTNMGGDLELGVCAANMFVTAFEHDWEAQVIGARVRPTRPVEWKLAPTGGVDSGIFGVWDAKTPTTKKRLKLDDFFSGPVTILGRLAYAARTGDGHYSAVVGRDDGGEVCVVLAGPGVRPSDFKLEAKKKRTG